MMDDRTAIVSVETVQRVRNGWQSVAKKFADTLAHPDYPRGELAELRRMDARVPGGTAYWRLMAQADLLGQGEIWERKWALIIQGIAIMTPTVGDEIELRSAHAPRMPVGRALFLGQDTAPEQGYFSALRLNRLLIARGFMFHSLLTRMFRMMGTAGRSFDWGEMAVFILHEGWKEPRADACRRKIARAYYRAEAETFAHRNQEAETSNPR